MGELIEKYDPEKIELIRMKLENSAKNGTPEYYEILVDDMPVVKRTGDLSLFDSYRVYTTRGVHKISFRLYGTAPKGWRHVLRTFVMEEPKSNETLSGIEIARQVKEQVDLAHERWENEQLKKEFEELKEQLKDAEDYIDKLIEKIEDVRREKGDLTKQWGELASVVVEGIIRRNAHKLEKIPGLSGVTKIFDTESDNPSGNERTEPEGEAVFRKKNTGDKEAATDEERQYLHILRDMEERLDEKQLRKVMCIFHSMMEEPENIAPVAELLNININA